MENNDSYLKRLIYQSWHRGCKETDILLGRYAKAKLASLTQEELKDYEKILTASDNDIYDWLTEKLSVPIGINVKIVEDIRNFHHHD